MPEPEINEPSALEIVQRDLERNVQALATATMYDAADVKKYLKETLWPTLEAIVDAVKTELAEQAEAIDELIENEEEILHGETAELIVGTLSEGLDIVTKLLAKLPPADKSKETITLRARAQRYGAAVQAVIEQVAAITIPDDAVEDEDEDDDDEADAADEGGSDAGH